MKLTDQEFTKMLLVFGAGFTTGFLIGPKDGLLNVEYIFRLVREVRLQKGAWHL